MTQFHFRNVNSAFTGLVSHIDTCLKNPSLSGNNFLTKTDTRNGPVVAFTEPVMIQYSHSRERVLFSKARDANPFFHIFEAIWMLSGSNLVKPLAYFASNMLNYSDDGETLNGAYGYRWRSKEIETSRPMTGEELAKYAPNQPAGSIEGVEILDQLNLLIEHLRTTPNSRRAVLQMWNMEDDLLKVGTPKEQPPKEGDKFVHHEPDPNYSKDVCCNLSISFHTRLEPNKYVGAVPRPTINDPTYYLDMTVFNRSNDMIWGALGANQVHFSFLQQYIAECCGFEVGVYNQISSNMHVYLNNWKPEEWLKDSEHSECYPELTKLPLVKDKEQFDKECKKIVEMVDKGQDNIHSCELGLQEPYLARVVMPMVMAFKQHKLRIYDEAFKWMELVEAPDWRRAGTEWLERREVNWKAKQGV